MRHFWVSTIDSSLRGIGHCRRLGNAHALGLGSTSYSYLQYGLVRRVIHDCPKELVLGLSLSARIGFFENLIDPGEGRREDRINQLTALINSCAANDFTCRGIKRCVNGKCQIPHSVQIWILEQSVHYWSTGLLICRVMPQMINLPMSFVPKQATIEPVNNNAFVQQPLRLTGRSSTRTMWRQKAAAHYLTQGDDFCERQLQLETVFRRLPGWGPVSGWGG